MTVYRPRTDYRHPGPLGPKLDLSRVTGWDIHHTATPKSRTPFQIADETRRKFGRSSYNFIVTPDATVWEMQGLHRGAHNDGENSTRLGLCFIGYYHPPADHRLTAGQEAAAARLMAHGLAEWGVPIHAKGHGATDATACPGRNITPRIPRIVAAAKAGPAIEDDMPYTEAQLKKIVQDAVFTAGFGRTNPESFGNRVGQIRVDTRDTRALTVELYTRQANLDAKLDALLEAVAEVGGLDVDDLAAKVAAKVNASDHDALLNQLAERLAD